MVETICTQPIHVAMCIRRRVPKPDEIDDDNTNEHDNHFKNEHIITQMTSPSSCTPVGDTADERRHELLLADHDRLQRLLVACVSRMTPANVRMGHALVNDVMTLCVQPALAAIDDAQWDRVGTRTHSLKFIHCCRLKACYDWHANASRCSSTACADWTQRGLGVASFVAYHD